MVGSAYRESRISAMRAEAHRKAARFQQDVSDRYAVAARTEGRVAALLGAMHEWG